MEVSAENNVLKLTVRNYIENKGRAAGSGVGLKSAVKIAELHGGSLSYGKAGEEFATKLSLPL